MYNEAGDARLWTSRIHDEILSQTLVRESCFTPNQGHQPKQAMSWVTPVALYLGHSDFRGFVQAFGNVQKHFFGHEILVLRVDQHFHFHFHCE